MTRASVRAGFVAIELVLAIGLLLFPVVLLVGSLPQWSERQHAAIVAAREAAQVAAQEWPADGGIDAKRGARGDGDLRDRAGRREDRGVAATRPRRDVDRDRDGSDAGVGRAAARERRRVVVDGERVGAHRRLPQPVRRDERGTMTLWVLGLCIAVLFLGGLSLDLWRVIAVRRSLVAMADAGATAGANGLDQAALRDGVLRLDPVVARADADAAR